mgnify:CR=1 FL=1
MNYSGTVEEYLVAGVAVVRLDERWRHRFLKDDGSGGKKRSS